MKVFTNGCFDGLHEGHKRLLRIALSLSDGAIALGLNSDESINRLKGRPPQMGFHERKSHLVGWDSRIAVFLQEDSPEPLIRLIQPEIIIKGSDWLGIPRPWDDVCPTLFAERL